VHDVQNTLNEMIRALAPGQKASTDSELEPLQMTTNNIFIDLPQIKRPFK
jgi:hypothetical protein